MQQTPSFLSALRNAVSVPGESATQFAGQIKNLSDKDKADLSHALNAAGIHHTPPAPKKP